MEKITAQVAAQKWGVSLRRVQDYCKRGKIPGAERFGSNWMIPADAIKPMDGRCKSGAGEQPRRKMLLRQSPFLDMTDLYREPGSADRQIAELAPYPETQTQFAAAIAYSRGQIDLVYSQAQQMLEDHTDVYTMVSGAVLMSLVALWKGDVALWYEARRHLTEIPCHTEADHDVVALSVAAVDVAIRNTEAFPQWFMKGRFDTLPKDAHPAARVYYVKHLIVAAQEVAMGNSKMAGVEGLGFLRLLPYIVEPMISQMVAEEVILAEIYLRLFCGIAYRQGGDDQAAAEHVDRAVMLCLADGLYGPLVEHRRQLGAFLDERIALVDPEALKKVKEMHKQLLSGWTTVHNAVRQKTVSAQLSPREREVARLVAFGFSDAQIASRLFLSESSVKALVRSAKNKTGVEKRRELIDFV